jgi:O-antigen/teichoic acid export membrane protein
MVARWLGADALGIYSRAYGLMLLPYSQVTSVLSSVMLATLSSLQADPARARNSYLRSTAVLALVTFPVSAGLALTAEPFVETLLGPKWLEVAPVLQILALVGPFQAIASPLGWIAQSHGRADLQARWGLIGGSLVIGALALGVWTGSLVGVAFSYLGINVLLTYPALRTFGPLLGLRPADVLRPVLPSLVCTGLMSLAVSGVVVLTRHQPSGLRLLAEVTLGVVTYVALVALLRLHAFRDLLEGLRLRGVRS